VTRARASPGQEWSEIVELYIESCGRIGWVCKNLQSATEQCANTCKLQALAGRGSLKDYRRLEDLRQNAPV